MSEKNTKVTQEDETKTISVGVNDDNIDLCTSDVTRVYGVARARRTMTENTERELRHISQIENPQLTEETIAVEAIVSGTSLSYLVPHRFIVKWLTDDNEKEETRRSRPSMGASSSSLARTSLEAYYSKVQPNRARK